MTWRTWVVVALLGAAVVAGAFLLPSGPDGDERLADAARAVLSSNSFRTTFSGPSRSIEDYIAPDRQRTISEFDGMRLETIYIGARAWFDEWCTTRTGTEQGYVVHDLDRPIVSGGNGWQMLVLASQADDAQRVAPHRYAFTVSLPVPAAKSTKVAYRPFHGVATVRDGVVRTMSVSRGSQGFDMRFSHLGTVAPIDPPTGPKFDHRKCTFDVTPQGDLVS